MIVKNIEKKEDNTAVFTVEADAAEFEAAVNRAYLAAKKDINIQGFRKGKAPRAIVEAMFGADTFHQGAFEELAPKAYTFALESENLKVVGTPDLGDMSVNEDKGASFSFTVALYPEVVLGQYKGIEVEKPSLPVTDEDVEKDIKATLIRSGRIVPVEDREARLGDMANINFDGYVDGVAFDGGKGENYDLELGSGTFIPGFEDQVVGMQIGEEKDLNVTFPTEYSPELAGKDAVFKVKLNSLTVKELPELDDEFAKDNGFDTLDEYKADVRANLEKINAENEKNMFRNLVLEQACKNMTVTVPEAMYKAKVEEMIRGYAANYYGPEADNVEFDILCAAMGFSQETIERSVRPNAEHQVLAELLLEAVIKAENFEVSDEELEEYLKTVAESANANPEEVRAYYGNDFIRNEKMKDMARELVVDSAVAVEAKAE